MSRNPRTGKVSKSGKVKIARWVSERRIRAKVFVPETVNYSHLIPLNP